MANTGQLRSNSDGTVNAINGQVLQANDEDESCCCEGSTDCGDCPVDPNPVCDECTTPANTIQVVLDGITLCTGCYPNPRILLEEEILYPSQSWYPDTSCVVINRTFCLCWTACQPAYYQWGYRYEFGSLYEPMCQLGWSAAGVSEDCTGFLYPQYFEIHLDLSIAVYDDVWALEVGFEDPVTLIHIVVFRCRGTVDPECCITPGEYENELTTCGEEHHDFPAVFLFKHADALATGGTATISFCCDCGPPATDCCTDYNVSKDGFSGFFFTQSTPGVWLGIQTSIMEIRNGKWYMLYDTSLPGGPDDGMGEYEANLSDCPPTNPAHWAKTSGSASYPATLYSISVSGCP